MSSTYNIRLIFGSNCIYTPYADSENISWMHTLSGAHFGPLPFVIRITMEDVTQRLESLPLKRQKQFQRLLQETISLISPKMQETRNEVIENVKSKMLFYLAKEEKEKLTPRKHGSKGKKHREKASYHIQRIEKKLEHNQINYPLLFKELFNVTLREKHSAEGIGYLGLCPFHEEKTPSLSIHPSKGVIRCFWCGKNFLAENMLRNAFGVKYSRALGILEKYICTPEETQEWKRKNTATMQMFEETQKKKNEKNDFVSFLLRSGNTYQPYLPKKEFEAKFKKRKLEKEQKEERVQREKEPEDNLPF